MKNRDRSILNALSDSDRVKTRQAAVTMAQQGLSKPMVDMKDAESRGAIRTGDRMVTQAELLENHSGGGAPATQPIHARPQPGHPPGNQGGTYNGEGPGSHGTTSGGREMLARVASQRAAHKPKRPARPMRPTPPVTRPVGSIADRSRGRA